MFTIKNAVYVAIMQVWVIVMGVLGGGLCVRAWTNMKATVPAPVATLVNYHKLFLVVPLIWITLALLVRRSPNFSDETKGLAFGLGIMLLIVLGIFVIYADVTPWFHVTWNIHTDDES